MQQRADKIPLERKIRLTESLQRLVDLYASWNKPAEAAIWQTKLDEFRAAASSTESKQ